MNDQIQQLHASIAKIEAQLYAIGSGGVGASIQPPVQADTAQAPVAWRIHPFDYGVGYKGVYALTGMPEQVEMWRCKGWKVEPLYTAPQPTENLRCKSTQKRLATLWGYEKARQPLTDVEVYDLIVSVCSDGSAPSFQEAKEEASLTFKFARAVEAAHGIGGNHG